MLFLSRKGKYPMMPAATRRSPSLTNLFCILIVVYLAFVGHGRADNVPTTDSPDDGSGSGASTFATTMTSAAPVSTNSSETIAPTTTSLSEVTSPPIVTSPTTSTETSASPTSGEPVETTPGPCSRCDPVGSECGLATNMTCVCASGYTGNGVSCAKVYVIDTASKIAATMNTSTGATSVEFLTTVFGVNSTSSGEPWLPLATYVNLKSNETVNELSQPGTYIIRTCQHTTYPNDSVIVSCERPFFASTIPEETAVVNAIVDWVNRSAGGSASVANVTSVDGMPNVAIALPNITNSIYSVWVAEYRAYKDECQRSGFDATECAWMEHVVNASSSSVSIPGLGPGSYEVRLHAETRSNIGSGRRRRRRQTSSSSLYTLPIVIIVPVSAPGSIDHLAALGIAPDALNVSWEAPESFNGVPLPYIIALTSSLGTTMTTRNATGRNETVTFVFNGLVNFTSYMISVTARSNGGMSRAVSLTVTTAPLPPGPVVLLDVVLASASNGSATARVTWDPPLQRNGNLTHYTIRYQVNGSSTNNALQNIGLANRNLSIRGLVLHRLYHFTVFAYTSAGPGVGVSRSLMTPIGAPPPLSPIQAADNITFPVSTERVSLAVTAASNSNGPIVTYAILVSKCTTIPIGTPSTAAAFLTCTAACQCPPYVALFGSLAAIRSSTQNGQSVISVGNASTAATCSSSPVCNIALQPNTSYTIAVRAYTRFYSTGSNAQPTLSDFATTGNRNLFTEGTAVASTAPDPEQGGRGVGDSDSSVTAVALGAVFGVMGCLALLAGGHYYLNRTSMGVEHRHIIVGTVQRRSQDINRLVHRRKRNQARLGNAGGVQMTHISHMPSLFDMKKNSRSNSRKGPLPGRPTTAELAEEIKLPDEGPVGPLYASPIPVSEFVQYLTTMAANSDLGFSKLYETVCRVGIANLSNASMKVENRAKNRYSNIVAYDHSRVKLQLLDGDPHSDYINANYIHHPNQDNAYIATQGPLPITIQDFWRMIWEQQASSIVMVTNMEEKGRVKCHWYWPTESDIIHNQCKVICFTKNVAEPLTVEFVSETVQSFATVRTLLITQGDVTRQVNQYHFTHWPDHGVPGEADELLRFVLGVWLFDRRRGEETTAPVVVHCSAGVGRTGTYIAVDTVLRQLLNKYQSAIDLLNIACRMRWQRVSMIQTEVQFIYVHQCVSALIDYIHTMEDRHPQWSRSQVYEKILEERYNIR